ncbi:MAG: O-antigen ligase family protein [Leptolyngbya sp. SIO4C5]|nr:O-antigen ligase family protein [Leptolyngbya sp. SIO4C5]
MSSSQNRSQAKSRTDGQLLCLLTAIAYGLFTLLPGSNSLMVLWPWVFVWQVTLALPFIWLLWQLWHKPSSNFRLGNGWDWGAGLTVLGIGLTTILAEFPQQARWYGWAALCGVAALYALSGWLTCSRRWYALLVFQAGLGIAFIVLSLGLWIGQTYLPELDRLQTLQQYGVVAEFNFGYTSLRNWHPIGHQNYVAGYLMLILPLLAGFSLIQKGWRRWIWLAGLGLGLVDLYTTSSRGGFLGLAVLGVATFLLALWRSQLPKLWLWLSGLGFAGILLLLVWTNSRLRSLIQGVLTGQSGGEVAYRLITNLIGWRMGADQPLTGVGLGGVPIVYQEYRPAWAGREAELAFQLHSSPAQLWGEMGVWGLLIPLVAIGLLVSSSYRWATQSSPRPHQVLVWSLLGGLLAYTVMSLTDYQLDNLCISGALIIFLAALAHEFRQPLETDSQTGDRLHKWLFGLLAGFFLVVQLWLVPVHRAWAISNSGFAALNRGEFAVFVDRLKTSHQLAPWEPYYAYQLAWNLGEASYQTASNPAQSAALRQEAIEWFERAIAISPYQEFGYSNLGWLQVQENPAAAVQAFARSAQLVPAKQGVFFGLGFSLLLEGQRDLAVEALTLEALRHPLLITSPVWQSGILSTVYGPVMQSLEQRYTALLEQAENNELIRYLHQSRGSLRWWRGDLAAARQDWQAVDSSLGQALIALEQNQLSPAAVNALPNSPGKYAILAWLQPDQRIEYLERAWVSAPDDLPQLDEALPPETIIQQLAETMDAADSLKGWLRTAPTWNPRSNRLGFGALSRHIDGPLPTDYYPRTERLPMSHFFDSLFDSSSYRPQLEQSLQAERDRLIQQTLR